MTNDDVKREVERPPTPRERHEAAVAKQMRDNLRKRKAKQRVLQERSPPRSTDD